ncbi:MAG: PrgI family protein [Candidatus Saccharibacteria bacterium]
MGQYKVPQDVEAEDKLIGPLSLRQFIYVLIGLGWAGLMFLIFRSQVIIMVIAIIPITGFFLILGFGRRKEQSFERYFVAWLQFMFVPRVRVWDKDLVQDERIKADLTPPEVITNKNIQRSSLQQLALVMDTHGTMKDPTIQLQDENNNSVYYSQRVISPGQIPGIVAAQQPNTLQVTPQDDMLDGTTPRSEAVNQMLENQEANIHDQALARARQNVQKPQQLEESQTVIAQPQTSGAIIKKAMLQSDNLTVQQIAKQANSQEMAEGQIIKIPLNGN